MFADIDQRQVEQDLVEILPHVQDRVGDGALEPQGSNLIGEFRGAESGIHSSAGVDQLRNLDLCGPRLFLIVENAGEVRGRGNRVNRALGNYADMSRKP